MSYRRPEVSDDAPRRRTKQAIERVSPATHRRVLRAYVDWLREKRKLTSSSIERLVATARRLLADWVGSKKACVARLRRLVPEEIERFLVRRRRRLRRCAVLSLHEGTVRFLQFCTAQGWLPPEFPDRVPSLPASRGPWTPNTPRRRAIEAIARVPLASARRVLHAYARWLEYERGLATSSIEMRLAAARTLLASWLGDETACVARLRRLSVDDVEDVFLCYHDRGGGQAAQRSLQAGLRLFLRFCATQRWVSPDLAAAVPSMRSYRLSTVPRGVFEADVATLVAELSSPSPSTMRDRAIVLLLVTYGVRRAQVAALRLRDFDWRTRRVTFPAHKGGRAVLHVLTPAVAEALAEYLRQRPPECEVEHVFLRARAPHVGIGPGIVTAVVAKLFEAAKIESRPRGPHAFRHAFAMRILAARKPFKTVADLLGHRSLSSVAVYAKVDVQRLLEAPLPWPEVLR